MKRYLVGVDLGTSGTKASLFLTSGQLVAEAGTDVPLYYPAPGVVEQDNDDFYRTAAKSVRRCIAESGIDPKEIAAISFASQMAGIGSVDEQFRPATRFDSWLDMRCQPYIEQMDKHYGDRITQLTGCAPTCDHGPKMLWWKEEQPEQYARVSKFVTPAGYVAGRMAGLRGESAFMDYTFIHFSGLVDAQRGVWSDELSGALGIGLDKLARIVAPWDVIGEVTDASARDFGLAPGTPIAAGCGDTAAGALGAGIVRPGMVFDTAGTASVFAGCTDKFAPDIDNRALLVMRSVIPGLWNPLAYVAGGGLALRWFRDNFYNAIHGQAQEPTEALYREMGEAAAAIAPGADGLAFSPHLGGRICPSDSAMRGAWVGFSWQHAQAHFYRAILESVAFEYAYYLRILRSLIPDLELVEARVIGGGARSDVWNQIKADVLGIPFQRLQRSEFATWGCALIAGRAVGIFDDLAEAATRSTATTGVPTEPRAEVHAAYQPLVEQHMRWQAALAEAFRTIPIAQNP